MNLKVREFQIAIRTFIQENDLPTEVKRVALKEIMVEVEEEANRKVREEADKRALKQKKSKEVKKQDAESVH